MALLLLPRSITVVRFLIILLPLDHFFPFFLPTHLLVCLLLRLTFLRSVGQSGLFDFCFDDSNFGKVSCDYLFKQAHTRRHTQPCSTTRAAKRCRLSIGRHNAPTVRRATVLVQPGQRCPPLACRPALSYRVFSGGCLRFSLLLGNCDRGGNGDCRAEIAADQ